MRYSILAAALLLAGTAPAAHAMAVDADERELYDNSIECMAYFGIMAGLGGGGEAEDPKMAESGTKFLAIATVLADEDEAQIHSDFDKKMTEFALITKNPENPDNVRRVKDIDENCRFMETLVDAMLESGS